MRHITKILASAAAVLVLAGCSDSNNFSQAPQDELPVDFTAFVKTEVQKQAVDLEPVNINDLEFSFNDQDNEQAFDDLF